MRKLVFLFMVFFIILISTSLNAQIFLAEPKEIYNLNDILEINLSVKETADSADFLQVTLVCPYGSVVLHRQYIYISAQKEYFFDIKWPISTAGLCIVKAEFAGKTVSSKEFIITNRIDVYLELNKENLLPQDVLIISGRAVKANSLQAEGFAEIKIPGLSEAQYVNIKNGSFTVQVNLPANIPAQEYRIQVFVFEKNDKGETTNKGFGENKFSVVSVPSKLDLSINDEKFLPNQTVIIKASLYDQSLQLIEGDVNIIIKDTKGRVVDTVIKSGTNFGYLLQQNAIPGDWQIEASAYDFNAKRTIYVERYESIDISLQDNKLVINNMGNVPFKKQIEIRLLDSNGTEKILTQDIDLNVAEDATLKLSAPNDTYSIDVEGKEFTNVPLTGAVTASVKLQEVPGILTRYPALSIFLFVLLLVMLVILLQKASKRTVRVKGYAASYEEKPIILKPSQATGVGGKKQETGQEIKKDYAKKQGVEEVTILPQLLHPVRIAESSLVMQGQRQKVSVLYFRAKNIPELQSKISVMALEALKNFAERTVINVVESYNGAVQKISEAEIMAIFSPALRQFRHESSAVKAAAKIDVELKAYNRKLKSRLDYGLGINSGELILNISKKKVLQYTSTGKTIAIARKLAEKATQEAVISNEVYRRVMPEVKAKNAGTVIVGGDEIECYILEGISSREAYSSYVHDILRRIK